MPGRLGSSSRLNKLFLMQGRTFEEARDGGATRASLELEPTPPRHLFPPKLAPNTSRLAFSSVDPSEEDWLVYGSTRL